MRLWRTTRSRRRSGYRRGLKWVGAVLGVALTGSWALVLALRWIAPPVTAFMLIDSAAGPDLDYEWVDFGRIATGLPIAVMAAEDQKFPVHSGFDLESIRDALDERRDGGRLRGASTITQQVAKNLFLWPGQSYLRKAIEAYFTVLIEVAWPKRRILEVYVNVAEFGPGVYGAGAASRRYFGKPPDRLTDAEAALLAAVLPSPKRFDVGAPSAYLRERQRWILGQMRRLRAQQILAAVP